MSPFCEKYEECGEDRLMFLVGGVRLFFVLPYGDLPMNDRFSPNRIGLEHFAFGVTSVDVLQQIEVALDQSGIVHSGIHIDSHSSREKIRLDDPNGIRLEFYLREMLT